MALREFTSVKDLSLADAAAAIQDKSAQLIASLPKLAQAARETGRSLAEHSAAVAERTAHRLRDEAPDGIAAIKAASARVASSGRNSGLLAFAARRPVAVILGTVAVTAFGIALGRWLVKRPETSGSPLESGAGEKDEIGEGSYAGTRDYHDRARTFLEEKGKDISKLAHEAEAALEGPEGPSLEEAEQRGRSHAKA